MYSMTYDFPPPQDIFENSQVSPHDYPANGNPPDLLVMMALEKTLNDDCTSLRIATLLVTGEHNRTPRGEQEHYDILAMNMVLDFSQAMGDKDLHKYFDFPVLWIRRWTSLLEEALDDDTPSTETMERWMAE